MQAVPLLLRRPPEAERGAVVALDLDPIVGRHVAQRVHDAALVLRRSVELRRDRVTEGEGVECKPTPGTKRGGDPLEHLPLLVPAVQVQQRAERDVDQGCRLVDLELPNIAEPQLEWQARRPLARDLEHRRRRVDPEHGLPCLADDLDRDSSAADHQLDDRPVRLAGEARRSEPRPRSCRRPTRRRRTPRRRIRSSLGSIGGDVCFARLRLYAAPARRRGVGALVGRRLLRARAGARVAVVPVPAKGGETVG